MKLTSDLLVVDAEVDEFGEKIGRGLVASHWIPAGTVVAVFGGTAVDGAEFRQLDHVTQSHSIQVEDDVYLVPSPTLSPASLVNHSCAPTLRLRGQITLVAIDDIEPGQPLTYDYATSDSTAYDEFECECGAPNCREKVTGDDWMIPELQERYDGWFSPYLAEMIAGVRAADRDASGGLVVRRV